MHVGFVTLISTRDQLFSNANIFTSASAEASLTDDVDGQERTALRLLRKKRGIREVRLNWKTGERRFVSIVTA